MKKKKSTHILFCLHSQLGNWPCFLLTPDPLCGHRPHGFTLWCLSCCACDQCLATASLVNPTPQTEQAHRISRSPQDDWQSPCLPAHLSTQELFQGLYSSPEKEKTKSSQRLLFFENALLRIISHKRRTRSANHWYNEAMGGLFVFSPQTYGKPQNSEPNINCCCLHFFSPLQV